MKSWLVIAVVLILFSSCRSAAWFDTPNDLSNIRGTLYLDNGREVEGDISVNDAWNGVVKVYSSDERRPQRYRFSDVRGYIIRNEFYELKEIRDGASLRRAYRMKFMKRLTPPGSKMHLYEYVTKNNSYSAYRKTQPFKTTIRNYYIELPGEKEDGVWEIGLSKLVPNFDEKMSRIVDDCPSLSQKISNKEKGYFYSYLGSSNDKRVDMLWKIISEYNECRE